MPNVPESGPKTQSVRPAVPPTTQAPFTYKYLSESALLRAMFAHDFAKKICYHLYQGPAKGAGITAKSVHYERVSDYRGE